VFEASAVLLNADKVKDNFSINGENRWDNLVRDFSCALCVGKQAKIRMTPSRQPRLAALHVCVCEADRELDLRFEGCLEGK